MNKLTDDLRIDSLQALITPIALINSLPLSPHKALQIQEARETAANIIQGKDKRLLVVMGPCSIHDSQVALEYAAHLKKAAAHYAEKLFIIMRVYFEKPRTLLGWKGLISDPHLNGTFNINHGLTLARKILLTLAEMEMPAATEFLDTIIPQYLSDLVSWSAIGARTAESQIHRELASGLSMPVGFKNSTDGNVQIAIDAVHAARYQHHFLGISKMGDPSIISTKGNENCHIILRGGHNGPNYSPESIEEAANALTERELNARIMIDCSHGNSMKNYLRQSLVIDSVVEQLKSGSSKICGVMIESNLVAGKQTLQCDRELVYGQSITDACVSWEESLPLLESLANAV
ncbi:MAG: 3-deoxy-7-phosphoheptulonate synthase [Gammaproteobacteria bacterium]|nr:3-deoxy-7-phosphoheptulonate synthase [Gammaproteobacteria bacterium]